MPPALSPLAPSSPRVFGRRPIEGRPLPWRKEGSTTRHSSFVEAAAALATDRLRTSWSRALGYSPGAMAQGTTLEREEVLARVRTRAFAAARAWLSPADADDVAQETLLLLTTKYAHVEPPEELVFLAVKIVRFKCDSLWRKKVRRQKLGDVPMAPPAEDEPDPAERTPGREPSPEDAAVARQRLDLLIEAASRLEGRCREILRGKMQGLSFVEMAGDLRRPVNTVYSWDHRCHARLKALLGERWGFVSGRKQAR
jgi:RNA polymerase sigma factor (sigma-70 family)